MLLFESLLKNYVKQLILLEEKVDGGEVSQDKKGGQDTVDDDHKFLINLAYLMHENLRAGSKGFEPLYNNIAENIENDGILKLIETVLNDALEVSVQNPKVIQNPNNTIERVAAFCAVMQNGWESEPTYESTVRNFEQYLQNISSFKIKKIINTENLKSNYNWQQALFFNEKIKSDQLYNNSIWNKDAEQFQKNFLNFQNNLIGDFLSSSDFKYVVIPKKGSSELVVLFSFPNRIASLLGESLDAALQRTIEYFERLGHNNSGDQKMQKIKKIFDSSLNKMDQSGWYDILTSDEGRYGKFIADATDWVSLGKKGVSFFKDMAVEGMKAAIVHQVKGYAEKQILKNPLKLKGKDKDALKIIKMAIEENGEVSSLLRKLDHEARKESFDMLLADIQRIAKDLGLPVSFKELNLPDLTKIINSWKKDPKIDMQQFEIKKEELLAKKKKSNDKKTVIVKNKNKKGHEPIASNIQDHRKYHLLTRQKYLMEFAPAAALAATAWYALDVINIGAHILDDYLTIANSNYFEFKAFYEVPITQFIGGNEMAQFHEKIKNMR